MPHLESKTKLIMTASVNMFLISAYASNERLFLQLNGKNLAQSKIIHYLCSRILRWRKYVLRKAFRNGSFLGRFRTY